MPLDVDTAVETAMARLSEPKAEPAEDNPEDIATDATDGSDDPAAGTSEDEGQPEGTADTSDVDTEEDAPEAPEESAEEDGEPQSEPEAIPEDAVELDAESKFVVEVDGKPVALTGEELRNGYLRHDDYTRKRQADATARREAEERAEALAAKAEAAEELEQQVSKVNEWYEQRAARPPEWIAEIAHEASQGDPRVASSLLARSIYILNDANLLTPEMREVLQLEEPQSPTNQHAREGEMESRLRQLESEREQERQQEELTQRQQELVQEYLAQWQSIVEDEGLTFENPEAERRARAELVNYATEHEELDLEKAWLKMQRDRTRDVTTAAKDKVVEESTGGKEPRKPSSAVNRSSTPQSRAPRPPAKDYDEAADRAYQRLTAKAG